MKRTIYYLLAMLIAQSSTLLIGMESPITPPRTPRTPTTPSSRNVFERTKEHFTFVPEFCAEENIQGHRLQAMIIAFNKNNASASSSSLSTTSTINQSSSIPLDSSTSQPINSNHIFQAPDGNDDITSISAALEEKIDDTALNILSAFNNVPLSQTPEASSHKSFCAQCLTFFACCRKK